MSNQRLSPNAVVRILLVAASASLLIPGCAESERTPPTSPRPTNAVTAIAIVPSTDNLKVGESVTYSVEVSISGLPPTGPPPTWSSSNPASAAVDPSGKVTAIGVGDTTISVRFFGRTATRLVRILP
jgi:hypothetical protein